jgi:hypothetical protein
MAQMTADGKKKFGSSMVAKRYDQYHPKDQAQASKDGGGMPKRDTDYEAPGQPEYKADSMEHGSEKAVNSFDAGEAHSNPRDTSAEAETPSSVVQHHGLASEIEYTHDHDKGEHQVHSTHEDGHEHHAAFKDPALAYEAGGELQSDSVKRRTHPDQQGASSEGDNDEVPQHEAADLV